MHVIPVLSWVCLSARSKDIILDTSLDLDHYMCNMLYTPRVSRGPRGDGSRRQAVGEVLTVDVSKGH